MGGWVVEMIAQGGGMTIMVLGKAPLNEVGEFFCILTNGQQITADVAA